MLFLLKCRSGSTFMATDRLRAHFPAPAGAAVFLGLLFCSLSCVAPAQEPPLPPRTIPAAAAISTAPQSQAPADAESGGITEDELRQLLVGKTFYLRGGYLDDSLSFNEHGGILGHSPQGSYTLSLVEIDRVRLTKHKVELQGVRYGLHFLGALPYEDPSSAVDRVRITPRKKILHISIDREQVAKPKKKKENEKTPQATVLTGQKISGASESQTKIAADRPPVQSFDQSSDQPSDQPSDQASDPGSVTTTTSPAHAAQVLKDALANILAAGLDARMMAAMPEFWKLYYQAVAAKTDYQPTDPRVQRQNTVDRKARLVASFEPESNEYAQQAGVAGIALYHVVVGADGTAQEIAVGRPIGFGLDENAVAAIRKARFEPALKDGKPVPVLLDLVVEFRIYSKRTAAVSAAPPGRENPAGSSLPGPYSIPHPQ